MANNQLIDQSISKSIIERYNIYKLIGEKLQSFKSQIESKGVFKNNILNEEKWDTNYTNYITNINKIPSLLQASSLDDVFELFNVISSNIILAYFVNTIDSSKYRDYIASIMSQTYLSSLEYDKDEIKTHISRIYKRQNDENIPISKSLYETFINQIAIDTIVQHIIDTSKSNILIIYISSQLLQSDKITTDQKQQIMKKIDNLKDESLHEAFPTKIVPESDIPESASPIFFDSGYPTTIWFDKNIYDELIKKYPNIGKLPITNREKYFSQGQRLYNIQSLIDTQYILQNSLNTSNRSGITDKVIERFKTSILTEREKTPSNTSSNSNHTGGNDTNIINDDFMDSSEQFVRMIEGGADPYNDNERKKWNNKKHKHKPSRVVEPQIQPSIKVGDIKFTQSILDNATSVEKMGNHYRILTTGDNTVQHASKLRPHHYNTIAEDLIMRNVLNPKHRSFLYSYNLRSNTDIVNKLDNIIADNYAQLLETKPPKFDDFVKITENTKPIREALNKVYGGRIATEVDIRRFAILNDIVEKIAIDIKIIGDKIYKDRKLKKKYNSATPTYLQKTVGDIVTISIKKLLKKPSIFETIDTSLLDWWQRYDLI